MALVVAPVNLVGKLGPSGGRVLGRYLGLRGHFLVWQEQARDGAFENWEIFSHYVLLFCRCHNFLTFSRWLLFVVRICLERLPSWCGKQIHGQPVVLALM